MDNQQNQQSASGGYTYVGELRDSAFVVGRQIQNILLLGPAVLALRLTPNGGVSVESLAQCECGLDSDKHEGAAHKKNCPFMKSLQQLDSLQATTEPQKSQPVCDEVPTAQAAIDDYLAKARAATPTATEASLRRVTIEKRLKITVSLED